MNSHSNFNNGILRDDLKVGLVSTVAADGALVNLINSTGASGRYIYGERYGRGEVGELLLT